MKQCVGSNPNQERAGGAPIPILPFFLTLIFAAVCTLPTHACSQEPSVLFVQPQCRSLDHILRNYLVISPLRASNREAGL